MSQADRPDGMQSNELGEDPFESQNLGQEILPADLGITPERLQKLLDWKMPFGRYAGRPLLALPEPYLVWFAGKGYPEGELGELLELATVIKGEGLMPLFAPLLRSKPSD